MIVFSKTIAESAAGGVDNTGNAREFTVPLLRAARPLTNSRRVIANFIRPAHPILAYETGRMTSPPCPIELPLESDDQNWNLATNSPLLGA